MNRTKQFKCFANAALTAASLLLALLAVHLAGVAQTGRGLYDGLPSDLRNALVWAYPLLLCTGYLASLFGHEYKTRYDGFARTLLLLNGLAILIAVSLFLVLLAKSL